MDIQHTGFVQDDVICCDMISHGACDKTMGASISIMVSYPLKISIFACFRMYIIFS